MQPVHPGRILKRELKVRNLSANQLALALRVPSGRITSLLGGKRSVTADTALRLARYFWKLSSVLVESANPLRPFDDEAEIGEWIKAEVTQATERISSSRGHASVLAIDITKAGET